MGGSYPGQEEADTEIFMPVMTELEPLYNSMEVWHSVHVVDSFTPLDTFLERHTSHTEIRYT